MSEEPSGQDLEPKPSQVHPPPTKPGLQVAVAERLGAMDLAAHEQRVELREDRFWLPLLLPVGAILAVALFTINISRIFLAASQDGSDPAVIAAIIVTLGVLFGATF